MANELKLEQVITNVMINHIGEEGRHIGEGGCPRIQWYALRNELIKAITAWNTRPAAPVEGLETAAWQMQHRTGTWSDNISFIRSHAVRDWANDGFAYRELVTRSQAEAIIAAERARYHALEEIAAGLVERTDKAEADNAALTARVKAQVEHIATLDSNLEAMEKRAQEGETQLAAARKRSDELEGAWLKAEAVLSEASHGE